MSTNLCARCAKDDAAWRDSPPVRGGIRIHTIGGDRPRDAIDAARLRSEDHYDRVRRQRDLIARQCAEQHQEPAHVAQHVVAVTGLALPVTDTEPTELSA